MTDTPAEPAPVAPSSAGRAPVEPSVFTKIINGQIPGRFVWADDVCVAFATIEPHTAGHVLVVPRHQFESFTDADEATVSHLAVVARRIAATQMRVFDAARPGLGRVRVPPSWSVYSMGAKRPWGWRSAKPRALRLVRTAAWSSCSIFLSWAVAIVWDA